jgi:hypothetical protein
MFRRTKERTEGFHPWGITSPIRDNFTPRNQISLIGEKLKANVTKNNQDLIPVTVEYLIKIPIYDEA